MAAGRIPDPSGRSRRSITMSRCFEYHGSQADGDFLALIDLDKICVVQLEKEAGHHFPRIIVRFVDGHEARDIVPPEAAQQFVEAYRGYLKSTS
jgi:hypothetical protein